MVARLCLMTCVLQNLKGGKEVFPSTLKQDWLDFSCFLKIFNPLRWWFHRSFCNLKILTVFSFQGTWSSLPPVEVYYSLFSMSWWQDKAYSLPLFMHSLIYYFFSSVSCSLESFNTVSWLKCIKWDCGDQYHGFFGSGAQQLSTTQEMSSWSCQMLLCADDGVPVMFGRSGCYQKGWGFI